MESTIDSTQNFGEGNRVVSKLKIRSEGSGSKNRVGWQQDADPAVFQQTAKLSPLNSEEIDACYREPMVVYACAVQAGGEAEQRAKNPLEKFHRQLHNKTTVGIDKIYNKAKELGCKQNSHIPNP